MIMLLYREIFNLIEYMYIKYFKYYVRKDLLKMVF